jgi:hypothetical protein
MHKVEISQDRFDRFVDALRALKPPPELEASTHSFKWSGTTDALANCYFAIVAICHQTTPVGERRLEGTIASEKKYGWDYLKEKWLRVASSNPKWCDPKFWATLPPIELSGLYEDEAVGKTLNRINERAALLNNAGRRLEYDRCQNISTSFLQHGRRLRGQTGFLHYLSSFAAYRDPVMKKSMFFLSLVSKECAWELVDPDSLLSPVDYHELRGHLRIGTITVNDSDLRSRVDRGLVLSEAEDIALRKKVQEVNDGAAHLTGNSTTVIHYLCWNIFRNCCPRDSKDTHCSTCGENCKLPRQYKTMPGYRGKCVFSDACLSANKPEKIIDPPYAGDFY